MTLGVSGWRLHGVRTGVGRYLLNLIQQWTPELVAGRFDGIKVFSPQPLDPAEMPLPRGVSEVVLKSKLPMVAWENVRVGPSARQSVVLYPSYSRPFIARGATVVVTHDATMRLHKELYTRRDQRIYDPLYGWSARAATLVITTTNAARDDIARVWSVDPAKIRVTHLAPAVCFQRLPASVDRTALRARLTGADEPYFLFAGKLSGRRNLPLLLEAFADFRRRGVHPHRLVMVGPDSAMRKIRDMAFAMNITSHVVTRTFVSDSDLNGLYNCADALVMPSAYETVSFPILEAQATGTPVICIDTPGAREMTGAEALLIPKLGVDELATAMSLLASDAGLRSSLAERGLVNSRRFSWEKCASETLAICHEAAESGGGRR